MTEMTEREALEILEKKITCDKSSDFECLLRSCRSCDYDVRRNKLTKAIKVAACALNERVNAIPPRDGFVGVGPILASPQLAWLLKPYYGCPRGPMDLPGLTYESSGGALALLKDAEDYLVKGPDDTFVCVPKMWFDLIVKSLEEPREGTEDQDDQEPPIIEFPFQETKTADKPRLAEVLGVEEDEEWEALAAVCRIHNGFREIKRGDGWEKGDNEMFLTAIINSPNFIKRLPCPRFTEREIALMRAMGVEWVSRDPRSDSQVELYTEKPAYRADGEFVPQSGKKCVAVIYDAKIFPSVKPGDCLCLDGGPYADAGSPDGRAQP